MAGRNVAGRNDGRPDYGLARGDGEVEVVAPIWKFRWFALQEVQVHWLVLLI